MRNPDDTRMYLIERDEGCALPRVIPIWGRRNTAGIVTFNRPRSSERQWVMPDEAFDTELEAWQHIAKCAEATLAAAQHTVATAQAVHAQIQDRIQQLTRESPTLRRG